MYKAVLQDGSATFKIGSISLVPRLLPYRKTESLKELITCPVTYYARFYVWF